MVLMVATVALAACGSADKPPVTNRDAESGKVVVAALGDSITAGTPFYDPASKAGDANAPYTATAQKQAPGTVFRNCGVNGERTDEIAQRLDDCARGAKILIIEGGINDIAQGQPVSDAAANIGRMVRRGKELGLRVGVCELLPWNNGYPGAVSQVNSLNRSIHEIARRQDVTVEPWYSVLEDPAAPGRMRADQTVDGDHPTQAGYALLGAAITLPR